MMSRSEGGGGVRGLVEAWRWRERKGGGGEGGVSVFFSLWLAASLGFFSPADLDDDEERAKFKLTGRGHGGAAEDARHAAHEGGLAAACDEFCKRVGRAKKKSEVSGNRER